MKHKSILIFGGTDGIGRALADRLAPDNRVLIVGRSHEKGATFQRLHGKNARFISTDLSLLRGIPALVEQIQSEMKQVDFVIHSADILRTERINSEEGLEKSIAINYYSRVLLNDLLLEHYKPQRIVHIAGAGFPMSKNFRERFPVPDDVNSFTGHSIGQIANDFYGLHIAPQLHDRGTRINILNPGMVDTDIRRNGQMPWFLKLLAPVLYPILWATVVPPEKYVEIPLGILQGKYPDADQAVMINPKGKAIQPKKSRQDENLRRYIWEETWKTLRQTVPLADRPAPVGI